MRNAKEALESTFQSIEEKMAKNGKLKIVEDKIEEAISKGRFYADLELKDFDEVDTAFLIEYLERLGYETTKEAEEKWSFMPGPGPVKVRSTVIKIKW